MDNPNTDHPYDFIIVGSGFGGSVSALRLCQKGYSVLMLEKGRRFAPEDFPKTNWNLKRFMWMPSLSWLGPFKMSFFRHVTIVHGIGYGGGSLVYANTLPVPKTAFYESGSWAGIADWETELAPHYQTALRMLGAAPNPYLGEPDRVLKEVAEELGRGEHVETANVAVYFGEPGKEVPDPYFDGEGPTRTGCTACGACMTGCRHGAKNTLDKNYLYLAEKLGLQVKTETEVCSIRPEDGGYVVTTSPSHGSKKSTASYRAKQVVLAAGVLGTVKLLLQMKGDTAGLPDLSEQAGQMIRTNNEALIGVISERRDVDYSKGIAISSIVHTDDHSHVEPVRYGEGSGFFRTMTLPHASGRLAVTRLVRTARFTLRHPLRALKTVTVPDWAKYTTILLYMRSLEETLSFQLDRFGLLRTHFEGENPPQASIPEATDIALRYAKKVNGTAVSMFAETLFNIPTTAHILGGACMGSDRSAGVIGPDHQVYGYKGLYVCDGSAISANPGVNPSLTITAMSERAMSLIPALTPTAPLDG